MYYGVPSHDDGCGNVTDTEETLLGASTDDTNNNSLDVINKSPRDDTNNKEEEVDDHASEDIEMIDDVDDVTESGTFDDVDFIEEEQFVVPVQKNVDDVPTTSTTPNNSTDHDSAGKDSKMDKSIKELGKQTKKFWTLMAKSFVIKPDDGGNNVTTEKKKKKVLSVRYDIDERGYCIHHPTIQLKRQQQQTDDCDSEWTIVRKKCPECIKEDCPAMLGESEEGTISSRVHDLEAPPSFSTDRRDNQLKKFSINFLVPRQQQQTECIPNNNHKQQHYVKRNQSIIQDIVDDFTPHKGDQKILRAIARTATVNAAVLITAATGGAAGAIGYATGGAITTKRLVDGIVTQDEKEITKSIAGPSRSCFFAHDTYSLYFY